MTGLDATQAALAAEHAAVYVYGALGAQTSRSAEPALYDTVVSAFTQHRARRDALTRAVEEMGGDPVAAAPSYDLPERLGTPAEVYRAARDVEEACAATYAAMVASTVEARRRWAVEALNDAAVLVIAFRGTPEMLPGAGEYQDR